VSGKITSGVKEEQERIAEGGRERSNEKKLSSDKQRGGDGFYILGLDLALVETNYWFRHAPIRDMNEGRGSLGKTFNCL